MQIRRVIPVLLIHKGLLYKTQKFKSPRYVGDPINAVRIFNDKEVDEIVILDIDATVNSQEPDYNKIREIAGEAFMPLSYGGGVSSIDHVKKIIDQGVEKVIFSSSAIINPNLITQAVNHIGSSSTVVCLDIKKKFFGGYEVYINNGLKPTGKNPIVLAKELESAGIGELIINSIDQDGLMTGYDIDLLNQIEKTVNIPIVMCGGARSVNDLSLAFDNGATGAAAGSMFVFHGKHKAVLITYPSQEDIKQILT